MMGRHRYVRETSHAIHWTVDQSTVRMAPFSRRAPPPFRRAAPANPRSTSPRATLRSGCTPTPKSVIEALSVFWTKGTNRRPPFARLRAILEETELGLAEHEPVSGRSRRAAAPRAHPPRLGIFSIDELDPERHEGALRALELAGDEVNVSAPVYQEGVCIAYPELARGAPQGVLPTDFLVWSDGAYSYVDYVFRGVAKAARLVDPPVGMRDLDE